MHFNGHGSEGGGQVTTSSLVICATNWPGRSLSELNLHYLKVAVWEGCYTALTDASAYKFGNIMEQTHDQGAACAVGFKDEISWDPSSLAATRQWANAFWQALAQGNSVQQAFIPALRAVQVGNEGATWGFDSADWAGDSSVVIMPVK